MKQVERYGMLELKLAAGDALPAQAQIPEATFILEDQVLHIRGFCENEQVATVRFMPEQEGIWRYRFNWNGQTTAGTFACVPNTGANHGMVRTRNRHFCYADATRFIPMGTTCYAWIHQEQALMRQTLESLKNAPFNKVRMCVFPKSMAFNQNDPDTYPFEKDENGGWDVNKPSISFWTKLESCIAALGDLGIEADLILFHPYDRWGFSKLSREQCLAYLDYCVRRLGSYRNIWWSLANEYDLMFDRNQYDWHAFGQKITQTDPYRHLVSIHNWLTVFPKADWMTHISLQHHDMDKAFEYRTRYDLPLMVDECGYEGNIEFDWGNLSAFELINRMWTAVGFGCYCTHGETFYREDEVLWWAKGGKLYGEAVHRIRFLMRILQSLPGPMEPYCKNALSDPCSMAKNEQHAKLIKTIWEHKSQSERDVFVKEFIKPVGVHPDYRLIYLQRHCPAYIDLSLPRDGSYQIEVIDTWEMTRTVACGQASAHYRLELPAKEGMAVLITRITGQSLVG